MKVQLLLCSTSVFCLATPFAKALISFAIKNVNVNAYKYKWANIK